MGPPTSTCPKVCTRGTTSSLWSSASCWIRSMSSSLGGQGQAHQGMPGQRAECEGTPSSFSSSGTLPVQPWPPHACVDFTMGTQILTRRGRELV